MMRRSTIMIFGIIILLIVSLGGCVINRYMVEEYRNIGLENMSIYTYSYTGEKIGQFTDV